MITIPKQVLFQLMHSHTRLAEAEYARNPAYNDSHFANQAEWALLGSLQPDSLQEYFKYVEEHR
jgi:hypothetical protein